MNRSGCLLWTLLLLTAVPRTSAAQGVVNGSAELDAGQSSTHAGEQASSNGSFGQSYSLGWGSTLWDPRILRYTLQGTFRTQAQSIATTGRPPLKGHLNDFGYAVGANLLQASVMPFFIQASRSRDTLAGDLALSNGPAALISGVGGVPAADYQSINHNLGLGWHLAAPRLPSVSFGYQRASSVTTGGGYEASQHSSDLSGAAASTSSTMHQTLRYQSTSNESVLLQTFAQRLGTLDYDFGRTLSPRSRLSVRAGRRTTFSKSVFQPQLDLTAGAYTPAAVSGDTSMEYGVAGYAWDPNSRVSLRADGDVDRQSSELGATSSLLGSLSGNFSPMTGLNLSASGTGGTREQIVNGARVSVLTRSTNAGASYAWNGRHVGAGASGSRGIGTNSTPEGRTGTIDNWATDLHVSGQLQTLSANAGYGRSVSADPILDFGNYTDDHLQGSVQMQLRRGLLSVDASDRQVSRGRDATFMQTTQRTLSATGSFRVLGRGSVAASAGRFHSDYSSAVGVGTDRNLFWNLSFDSPLARNLQLATWLRSENAVATRTEFTQKGLSGAARVDYRLRTLKFQFEFRKSRDYTYFPGARTSPTFTGRQVRFSVTRQFGGRLR